MNKRRILYYDDVKTFTDQFEQLMKGSGFDIVPFNNLEKFRAALADNSQMITSKAVIFDLAKSKEEESKGTSFEIVADIKKQFNLFRIPIFIHSAFADRIADFDNYGTVWKVEKSGTSLENITQIIRDLDESGFLEAFTPGGVIERSIMEDLHRCFTEQFRKGEIELIINSIKKAAKEPKDRTILTFRRIALKTLMAELASPIIDDNETVNAIEHYHRRISKIPLWTGDIFVKVDGSQFKLVITPRCNVANNKSGGVMLCEVSTDFPLDNKKDKIKHALTDHHGFSGNRYRYLPPTPFFKGGSVDLAYPLILPQDEFLKSHNYVVSLSDDLTNEILGKFGAYFLRTGIKTINHEELIAYLDSLTEPAK